jgi:hypothetical protein
MKIYIYYDKITKIYKSNEFSEKPNKYPNCDCLEIEEEDWLAFINTYPEVIKIEAGKLKSEKRIKPLQELKDEALSVRKAYLIQTANEWGGAWEDCPQGIKDKRALARMQKTEIEAITNKEDLEVYNNNFEV